MDLSEPKLISPLLDGFIVGEPISDHHGVCCYPAIRTETDEQYILKIISIPASQTRLDALLLSGAYANQTEALAYFEELAQGTIGELNILSRLNKLEGFLPFSGYQLEQMDDGVGFRLHLLCPYRRSLAKLLQLEPLTHLGAVNLGLDLCAALATARRAGFLYIDLKPENVFLTETQGWRIGDLGFLPIGSLKFASLPDKYRSRYTAPEIKDVMSELNDTLDVYALGLVLYQVYNNGELPSDEDLADGIYPPPLYADYEMAEILLKACNPDPGKRWQDPSEMGQAITNYMQRNSVNDISLIPAPIEPPPPPEPDEGFLSDDENELQLAALMDTLLPEQPPADIPVVPGDAPLTPADPDTDLSFINDSTGDETAPSEDSVAGLQGAPVTDEVAQMLAQADDLISHELPEPAVAPDPIDVPFPAPIVLQPEGDTTVAADPPDEQAVPSPDDAAAPSASLEPPAPDDTDTAPEDEDDEPYEPQKNQKKTGSKKVTGKVVISILCIIAFIGCVCLGGYLYYQYAYLQNIDGITMHGGVDQLTVIISSDIDDDLLTVFCTDTYGNVRHTGVVDGKAEFTNLNSNTQYRIQISISGFHKLIGTTMGSYTTATQTEILNFNAIAGTEDGSVILSFSVNGPDSERWSAIYSAPSGKTQSVEFAGHTVTIPNLAVGTKYTFLLAPIEETLYLSGTYEISYTAQKVLYAHDLVIDSCGNGSLNVVWSKPEDAPELTWNVRCYNDAGYDEIITTNDTTVQFTGLDHTYGYTVTVTAVGMTQSVSASVTPDPITLNAISAEPTDHQQISVFWEFSGKAPAQGWVLTYSVDGGDPQLVTCANNSTLLPLYPGSQYDIKVQPKDEITFYGQDFTYKTSEAIPFDNYLVTAEDMHFYMCRTPDKEDWNRHDVPQTDFRNVFASGEQASFLIELWSDYNTSDDTIETTYVIRNANSNPISLNSVSQTWRDMWSGGYCELDIPQLPVNAGSYSVEIYFNGYYITTQNFTIT